MRQYKDAQSVRWVAVLGQNADQCEVARLESIYKQRNFNTRGNLRTDAQ